MSARDANPGAERCAICESSNDIVDICTTCRADPANVDWRVGEELLTPSGYVTTLAPLVRHADLIRTRRRRTMTDLQRRVRELLTIAVKPVKTPYFYRGRLHSYRTKWVPASFRDIARAAGCSPSYVHKVALMMLDEMSH